MPLEPSTTPRHILTVSQENYGLTVEENNWDLTLAYAAISIAPNSVTSTTTSDGTANLSLSNVTTATATVSGTLTANHIHGNLAGTVYTHVRTGEAMSKGDPFYIDGFHSGYPRVMKADASDPLKMPAVGVMDADYPANTNAANGIIIGTLTNVDTDGFGVNTPIYVADGGGYSVSAGTIPQQIGITERDNQNNGAFIVTNSKVLTTADIANLVNGTASLSVAAVVASDYISTVGDNAGITTSGNTAYIHTIGESAYIYTSGESASVYTGGQFAYVYTSGLNASMFTSGDNASIYTSGANAGIYTNGLDAPIYTMGGNAHISTQSATAYIETRSTFRLFDGTYATTLSHTPTADNAIAFQDGSGTVAFTSDLPTFGANVATFLETPTSANLAAAVTDGTGTESLVFANGPTLNNPTLNNIPEATLAAIATLTGQTGAPPVVLFDDFYGSGNTTVGMWTWADGTTGTAGTGSTDAGNNANGSSQYAGMCRINTAAVSGNGRIRFLNIGASGKMIGAQWRACFAIPDITNVRITIGGQGGGGAYELRYDSSANSGQWVLAIAVNSVYTIYTFTTATALAGDFQSGKRYRMSLTRTSATLCTLVLEIADYNLANWSDVFRGTITHLAHFENLQAWQPMFTVTALEAVVKRLCVDWISVYNPNILR